MRGSKFLQTRREIMLSLKVLNRWLYLSSCLSILTRVAPIADLYTNVVAVAGTEAMFERKSKLQFSSKSLSDRSLKRSFRKSGRKVRGVLSDGISRGKQRGN